MAFSFLPWIVYTEKCCYNDNPLDQINVAQRLEWQNSLNNKTPYVETLVSGPKKDGYYIN